MAIDLSEDTTLVEEELTAEQEETKSEFSKLVVSVDDESADDETDEQEVEGENPETDEVEAAPAIVEGPSLAMKAEAERRGLPPQLVALASSDAQLEQFVHLAESNMPREQAEAYELSLPDDEYPEDDPVRKELTRLQSHFSEQLNSVKQELGHASGRVREFENQRSSAGEQVARSQQLEFDRSLDEMGTDGFGKSNKMSSSNIHLRTAAYSRVQELVTDRPEASVSELADEVAKEFGFKTRSPQEKAAIRTQSNKRLGGGPAQPAQPAKQSDEKMMSDFLKAAGLKR